MNIRCNKRSIVPTVRAFHQYPASPLNAFTTSRVIVALQLFFIDYDSTFSYHRSHFPGLPTSMANSFCPRYNLEHSPLFLFVPGFIAPRVLPRLK
ncbi:hypothetical protein NPIL_451831 [Nephila pilipes]|uniref:Uncharacterized protein n=1 Tax=Nephila pilipes TaxID=299642 RepID=A0A8X6UC90_NEPPI|nr:hypothetical protein NPIL_451831 [Nephila pilipes]